MKQGNTLVPQTSAEHLHSSVPLMEILLQIKRKVSQYLLALALCPSRKDEKINVNQKKYLLVGLANQEGLALPKWKRKDSSISAEPFCRLFGPMVISALRELQSPFTPAPGFTMLSLTRLML